MIVEMALMVVLLASLIVNFVLVDQLEKAGKKIEEMQNERYW